MSRWQYSSANGVATVVGIAWIEDMKMMEERFRIWDIERE
jgi:hypothetical protein